MPLIKISKSNIPDTLNFRDSIFVPNDTTIKGDLYVDGNIFGSLADPTVEAHDHNYTDPLFDDVTTKGDLVVERNLSVLGDLFFALDDLLVQSDATVKDDLRVEGLIFGTLADAPAAGAHDHNYSTPIFHDTTIKHNLNVELGHIQGKIGRLDLQGLDSASEVKLIGPGVNNKIEIAANIFRVELGGSEHFVIDQTLGVFRSMSNEVIFTGTTGWGLLTYGLARFHDATVKTILSVEGRAEINNNLLVNGDLFIYRDATVKDDLKVEGLIFGTLADAPSPAAHDHDYSDPVFDDATIKDDLVVEGLIFGTLADSPAPGAHDHNYTDPIFNDTTVKNNIRVEGEIIGYSEDSHTHPDPTEAQDFKVFKDLVVQDDATVKDHLYVEKKAIICGSIFIPGVSPYIETVTLLHKNDVNTYIQFVDDAINFVAGNNWMFEIFEGAPDDEIRTKEKLVTNADVWVNKGFLVQDDATVKDDLVVEGNSLISGVSTIHGQPACMATLSVAQEVASGDWAKIEFDDITTAPNFDNAGNYDPDTNYRFTCPVAGIYTIHGLVGMTALGGPDKLIYLAISINGTKRTQSYYETDGVGATVRESYDCTLDLAENDFIEVFILHTHGSARNLETVNITYLCVVKVA